MDIPRRPPGAYRASRRLISMSAHLYVDGEVLDVMLLDVSRDGAKITVPFAILPGTAVALQVQATGVPALVQWCRDHAAGLRFLERLDRATLSFLEGHDGAEAVFD